MNRRALLVGAVSLAACGRSRPSLRGLAEELLSIDRDDVEAWLDRGHDAGDVLDAVVLAGVLRRSTDRDLHAKLISGPARRIGADEALVRWVVRQAHEWLALVRDAPRVEVTDAVPDWTRSYADSDPHPTIFASEVSELAPRLAPEDAAAVRSAVAARLTDPPGADVTRALAADALVERAEGLGERSGGDPVEVARAILRREDAVEGVVGSGAGLPAIWEGVWLAAASFAGRGGLGTNGVHAATVTWALQRLAASDPDRAGVAALTAVARLASDTPPVEVDEARWRAVGDPAAWLAAARRPGGDVHDLKYREALLHGTATLAPPARARVLGVAAPGLSAG